MTDVAERHWNPLGSIWLHPRDTVSRLVTQHRFSTLLWLAFLSGVAQALDQASLENIADQMPHHFGIIEVILGILFIGLLIGLIGLFAFSFALHISGKWFGGKASLRDLWVAVAWSSVPAVFALLLWVPEWYLFGVELFSENTPRLDASESLTLALFGFALLELTLILWSFVLLVATVSEVQALSVGKTLLNVLLGFIFIYLLIIPISMLVGIGVGILIT